MCAASSPTAVCTPCKAAGRPCRRAAPVARVHTDSWHSVETLAVETAPTGGQRPPRNPPARVRTQARYAVWCGESAQADLVAQPLGAVSTASRREDTHAPAWFSGGRRVGRLYSLQSVSGCLPGAGDAHHH